MDGNRRENMELSQQARLTWALLALRLTVFAVMLMWTIDKFVRPEHAAGVFEHFYAISGIGTTVVRVLGVLELALLTAFVAGFARRWSYGLVLLLHAVSTLSSWRQYLHPFEGASILFFAAWPMLAACLALYALRDSDTLTVEGRQQTNLGRA